MEIIYEFASRKIYLDSMVNQREGRIIELENRIVNNDLSYLTITGNLRKQNTAKDSIIAEQRIIIDRQGVEIKNARRKNLWQGVKNAVVTGVAIVSTGIAIVLAIDRDKD